jgi:hypothetical protein
MFNSSNTIRHLTAGVADDTGESGDLTRGYQDQDKVHASCRLTHLWRALQFAYKYVFIGVVQILTQKGLYLFLTKYALYREEGLE